MIDEFRINARKFGDEWPAMFDRCKECGETYAQHAGPNCPRDMEAAEKKARLEAAAPALLEALEAYRRAYPRPQIHPLLYDSLLEGAWELGDAAIKKARGEP